MDKKTKRWLITAAVLIFLGSILIGGAFLLLSGNFSKLSTTEWETNSYPISEDFKNISITGDTADIVFVPSKSGSTIVCYEEPNAKHTVSVKEGTLVIELADNRTWYDYIGIHFGTPTITLQIPQREYGHLSIHSSTGNVELPEGYRFAAVDISVSTGNITVNDLVTQNLSLSVSTGQIAAQKIACEETFQLRVSTGKSELTDIQCKNLISAGNTGDLTLRNVVAAETISLVRTTGDIRFDRCDAQEISAKTNTGDVTGTLLTEKIFSLQTGTGKITVPQTATGGKCNITTSTGNITLQIVP